MVLQHEEAGDSQASRSLPTTLHVHPLDGGAPDVVPLEAGDDFSFPLFGQYLGQEWSADPAISVQGDLVVATPAPKYLVQPGVGVGFRV